MIVLGIETSCDETSVALVEDGRRVLVQIVYSQIAKHAPYGGVVPEIAARCHVEALPPMLEDVLGRAGIGWAEVDRIAVTNGPGLASSLLVGLTAAQSLALRLNKPLVGVNHLAAHLYAVFLGDDASSTGAVFPLLTLLVSGGHTCLVRMPGPGRYEVLGQTLDDAAGEALDKGAMLLGLGYPGGPVLEKTARGGQNDFVKFPRALAGAEDGKEYAFSFSGLKTALRYYLKDNPLTPEHLADVAASYQEAVVGALVGRVQRALKAKDHGCRALACGGGVARNGLLRERLGEVAKEHGVPLFLAAPEMCTDNAAMVAGLAYHLEPVADIAALQIRPYWPLSQGC